MYRITRIADGKDYIGSKTFHTKSNPWPGYKSSSKVLKAEIDSYGMDYMDHFYFDMLFTCADRNSLALSEMVMQTHEDVIHNENNYNRAIAGQKFLGPTKHTPEAIDKIQKARSLQSPPNFKDAIIGIHVDTGERIRFVGKAELNAAGFNHGNVGLCIRKALRPDTGKMRKVVQGYKWYWETDAPTN